tara:strand:- start:83 stop:271 length:189 start_codon:yes stop_codon:yes gene_type:complete
MLKQTERWTGPGGGTPRLHHKHIDTKLVEAYKKVWGERWKQKWVEHNWCVYDGGEIGSTDSQ